MEEDGRVRKDDRGGEVRLRLVSATHVEVRRTEDVNRLVCFSPVVGVVMGAFFFFFCSSRIRVHFSQIAMDAVFRILHQKMVWFRHNHMVHREEEGEEGDIHHARGRGIGVGMGI